MVTKCSNSERPSEKISKAGYLFCKSGFVVLFRMGDCMIVARRSNTGRTDNARNFGVERHVQFYEKLCPSGDIVVVPDGE